MSEDEPLYDPNVFTCASEFMNWQEHNCKNCGYRGICTAPPTTEQNQRKAGTIRQFLCLAMSDVQERR